MADGGVLGRRMAMTLVVPTNPSPAQSSLLMHSNAGGGVELLLQIEVVDWK